MGLRVVGWLAIRCDALTRFTLCSLYPSTRFRTQSPSRLGMASDGIMQAVFITILYPPTSIDCLWNDEQLMFPS